MPTRATFRERGSTDSGATRARQARALWWAQEERRLSTSANSSFGARDVELDCDCAIVAEAFRQSADGAGLYTGFRYAPGSGSAAAKKAGAETNPDHRRRGARAIEVLRSAASGEDFCDAKMLMASIMPGETKDRMPKVTLPAPPFDTVSTTPMLRQGPAPAPVK